MKKLLPVLLCGLLMIVSCSEPPKPVPHFEMIIQTQNEDLIVTTYVLTDTSLDVRLLSPLVANKNVFHASIPDSDTIRLIAKLDPKWHNCPVQHAVEAGRISFKTDSLDTFFSPNVNHPKEFDYAVRMINSLVPGKMKIEFIDMQTAIEPDGQMRL